VAYWSENGQLHNPTYSEEKLHTMKWWHTAATLVQRPWLTQFWAKEHTPLEWGFEFEVKESIDLHRMACCHSKVVIWTV
jgi:hypothetical protein